MSAETAHKNRARSQVCTILVGLLCSAAVAGAGMWVSASGGAINRLPPGAEGIQADISESRIAEEIKGRLGCEKSCVFGNPDAQRTILLVGDSHIDHYTKTLKTLGGGDARFLFVYAPSCFIGAKLISFASASLGPLCAQAREQLKAWIGSEHPDAIVIGQRWPGYHSILKQGDKLIPQMEKPRLFSLMLSEIGAFYDGFEGPVVLVGHAPTTNLACYRQPVLFLRRDGCKDLPLSEHEQWHEAVFAFAGHSRVDIRVVEPVSFVCPGGRCKTTDAEGHILYTDAHHLSVYGAELVAPAILSAAGITALP